MFKPCRLSDLDLRYENASNPDFDALGPEEVASYSRYSSRLQDSSSNVDQQRDCREMATRNGHDIAKRLEYEDEAVSGKRHRRPGLDRLMRDAREGKFKVLYIFNLSRLARNFTLTLNILDKLVNEFGIRVISVKEGVDTNNKVWQVVVSVLAWVHEQFLDTLSDNIHKGHEGTLLGGYSVGDHRFGYRTFPCPSGKMTGHGRNAKPKMVYSIDEVQAEWVRKIFNWYVHERQSLNEIARQLTEMHAPKDHRSTKEGWHPQYVRGLLRSKKYVGRWGWGKYKNLRQTADGRTRQVRRSAAETSRWDRDRPDLQIVDDALFFAAQELLDIEAEKVRAFRKKKGQLDGSPSGTRLNHILAGLLRCSACGRNFHVSGSNGDYMRCAGALSGACKCRTSLPRQLAQDTILAEVAKQIQSNAAWREQIVTLTLAELEQAQSTVPMEIEQLQKQLKSINTAIERLLNQVERGIEIECLAQRLADRETEKQRLQGQLRRLESTMEARPSMPTDEWINQELASLSNVLGKGGKAAAEALTRLLDGGVELQEIRQEGHGKSYYRGTMKFRIAAWTPSGIGDPGQNPDDVTAQPEAVVIPLEFRKRTANRDLVEQAWELYQQQLKIAEIAKQLGVSKSRMSQILKILEKEKGIKLEDGRSRRWELPSSTVTPTKSQTIEAQVMELYHQQALLGDIAKRMGCSANLITRIIKRWHIENELPVPDGRSRRKQLDIKTRRGAEGSPSPAED